MNRLNLVGTFILLSALACADDGTGGGCACAGDYVYPRDIAEAAPTESAVRARVTETGFDSIGRAVPGILKAGCTPEGEDTSSACELSSDDPNIAKLYLGEPGAPLESSTNLLFTTIYAEVRSGECNGQPCHRSNLGLHLDSLDGNVHTRLINDADGPGIEMIFGCPESSMSSCSPDQFVNVSLDMVWLLTGFGAQNACSFIDDPGANAGITIESAKVVLRPNIELGEDLKPYLTMVPDTMNLDDLNLDFNIRQEGAIGDPACGNDGCGTWCTVTDWATSVVETLLQSEFLASLLAELIADSLVGALGDEPLEVAGELDLVSLLGVGNERSDPMGYLVTADLDSPTVTGESGNKGLNFDFDTGFHSEYVPCVPEIGPSSWLLPQIDPPGAVIQAPDPVTGQLRWENFDLMLTLGDVLLERAAYSLFNGGNLCINLKPEVLEELSGGTFSPTVSLISLIAPGLATMAGPDEPVTLALVPTLPMMVTFGSGDIISEDEVDSHIKIFWPDVELAIYPLIDDSVQRLLAFKFNLVINVSLVPDATGALQIMIDQLDLADVYESYNEIGTDFDPAAVADLIGVFLPTLLEDADAFKVDLGPETLGAPLGLKVRKLNAEGPEGRHLAVYLKICTESELGDPTNDLCYSNNDTSAEESLISGANIRFNENSRDWELHLADSYFQGEYAVRVDGRGPWYNYRAPGADGVLVLEQPQLRFPGPHEIEVMVRQQGTNSTQRVRRAYTAVTKSVLSFNGQVSDDTVTVHAWNGNGDVVGHPVEVQLVNALGAMTTISGQSGDIIALPGDFEKVSARLLYSSTTGSHWRVLSASTKTVEPVAPVSQIKTEEDLGCSATSAPIFWLPLCFILIHLLRRKRVGTEL
ncbi:MAG: hypothetical protein HOK97_08985 [Deltaproteobacteria bacterium]|jgi:hypothetical protein|nr:hypothetical protein [Deltaproteobacteria bacterium]MBT6489884.1 hypothetical protein [Deltaproteobacteria bacterium]